MSTARWLTSDVFAGLELLKAEGTQVDLVMTSPPFLALRSYLPADHPDKASEIGSEPTPAAFLDTMLDVVGACDRILAPHGSICFELGDTYSGSGGAGGDYTDTGLRAGQQKFNGSAVQHRRTAVRDRECGKDGGGGWPLAKSLTFMPELFGASLAYGRNLLNPEHTIDPWRVRNFVAWVRPNPPVGALGDKVRPATSYLTWACKSDKRWFDLDAVRQPASQNTHARVAKNGTPRTDLPSQQRDGNWDTLPATNDSNPAGAPPLDWWKISPGGYSGSHYAVYPAELCRIPIEASCPRRVCRTCGTASRREVLSTRTLDGEPADLPPISRTERAGADADGIGHWRKGTNCETTGWTTCGCPGTDGIRLDGYHTGTGWRPGIVLDPFAGSGTTLLAATGLSRQAIGIDLDERNADLARERVGMFLTIEGAA